MGPSDVRMAEESENVSFAKAYQSVTDTLLKNLQERLKVHDFTEEINCTVNTDYYEEPRSVNIAKIRNPLLEDASALQKEFMAHIPDDFQILFVGMNPSTKSLTGVPFFEHEAMAELFGSDRMQPLLDKLPNDYRENITSESGTRFWRFMKNKFGSIRNFFRHCFVINYCPLIFINKDDGNEDLSGFNDAQEPLLSDLMKECDIALGDLTKAFIPHCQKETQGPGFAAPVPKLIVGVGWYAFNRLHDIPDDCKLRIRHPSPRADNVYNLWEDDVESTLSENPVWDSLMHHGAARP